MVANDKLILAGKNAGIRIIETPGMLMIRPSRSFRHGGFVGFNLFWITGVILLIILYFKPGNSEHNSIGAGLALICISAGAFGLTVHFKAFITATPGRLVYCKGIKTHKLAIDNATVFKVKETVEISRSANGGYKHNVTKIIVQQPGSEVCIATYRVDQNYDNQKLAAYLADRLVTLLKNNTSTP